MDELIDGELQRMTRNPQVARAVKAGLDQMSKNTARPELAEMARELLAGRTDLRTIGGSEAYATQLSEAAEGFRKWQAELSLEERDELERTTRENLGDAGPE